MSQAKTNEHSAPLSILANHPFRKIFQDFLQAGRLNPSDHEYSEDYIIGYRCSGGEGVRLGMVLYALKDSPDIVFFHISSALTVITPETKPGIFEWITRWNNEIPHPLRLSVGENNIVELEFRGPASAIHGDYLEFILNDFLEDSDTVLKDLCIKFAARPFMELMNQQSSAA